MRMDEEDGPYVVLAAEITLKHLEAAGWELSHNHLNPDACIACDLAVAMSMAINRTRMMQLADKAKRPPRHVN